MLSFFKKNKIISIFFFISIFISPSQLFAATLNQDGSTVTVPAGNYRILSTGSDQYIIENTQDTDKKYTINQSEFNQMNAANQISGTDANSAWLKKSGEVAGEDSGCTGLFERASIKCIAGSVLYILLATFSYILGMVGYFFNGVFEITVINMKVVVDKIQIVQVGWTAIRDITNILFIFMLLYLAISTILQLDEHGVKHGLSRLIIGAVLINFSLFFVKVPIDLSNILAIQIYNKINPITDKGIKSGEITGGSGRKGLGDMIMTMFNPQTVFSNQDIKNINPNMTPNWNMSTNPITTFTMGIIIIFTAIFIFLAVILIFIKRFITLVLLMIFSPLAFAGMAIPNHDVEHQISHDFWDTLIKESFYAPVFMFMMYLTLKVGQGLNYSVINQASPGFFDNLISIPVTNIFSYTVVMGMMIFSLTVSEKLGVKGASGAIGSFNSMRGAAAGWAGRNTVGTLAYNALEKTNFGTNTLKQMRQGMLTIDGKPTLVKNPILRGITRGIGNSATGALTKMGEGHHHDVEHDMASTKDTLNELRDNPEDQARFLSEMLQGDKKLDGLIHPYDQKVAKYVGTAMKDDEVATMVKFMRDSGDKGKIAAGTLLGYLGKERQSNIEEMISNKVTRYHKIKLGDYADGMRLAKEFEYDKERDDGKGNKIKPHTIVVSNGHGGTEQLSGPEASKYLEKNYGHSTSGEILADAQKMMQELSEKQKTEILSTISSEQQKALANNDGFVKELKNHFTNYRTIDSAMKGSMAKELQTKLGLIAYDGVSKYNIDTTLRSELLKKELASTDTATKQKAVDLEKYLKEKWKDLNDNIEWQEKYASDEEDKRMKNLILDYKTLVQARQNFTRVATESEEFQEIINKTSGGYVPQVK